jgi:hypothetical protein
LAAAIVGLLDIVSLAAMPPGPTHYTTAKRGALPPGKSRRWLREHAPGIPGAKRAGRDWIVPVDAFDRWCEARRPKRAARTNVVTGQWSPEAALTAAGVREGGTP